MTLISIRLFALFENATALLIASNTDSFSTTRLILLFFGITDSKFGYLPSVILHESMTFPLLNEIKFLVDKGSIIGVVHIVDYNNEFVAVEIYRSFHRFENALRSLLMKNGLSNEDLISWVKINRDAEMFNSNEGFYWSDKYKRLMPLDPIKLSKVEKQRSMVYPFQTFYFSDLLEYALDINLLDRNIFITKSLYELRNFMAHNRHFIAMAESDEGQLIYNFNHLKNFVKNINTFFSASEELERLLNNNIKTSDSILIF